MTSNFVKWKKQSLFQRKKKGLPKKKSKKTSNVDVTSADGSS